MKGDCLGEGVFRLLDEDRTIQQADLTYCKVFLAGRLRLIEQVLARVPQLDKSPAEIAKMLAAHTAAYTQSQLIEPALCVEFLQAWQRDRASWRACLSELDTAKEFTPVRAPEKVLAKFGLTKQGYYLPACRPEPYGVSSHYFRPQKM